MPETHTEQLLKQQIEKLTKENEQLRLERDELEKRVDEFIDEKYAPRGIWGDFTNE